MREEELINLVDKIRKRKTEFQTIELKAAEKGFCLPLGADRAYKGSGIALAIDILCGILSGGCPCTEVRPIGTLTPEEYPKGPGICHAFGAIDIEYFMALDEFKARMDTYEDELKAAPLAPGCSEILMPGEPEYRHYKENLGLGSVEIALENLEEVKNICAKYCPGTDPEDYLVG